MHETVGARRALETGAELTASRRLGLSRYFFVGLGAFCILIAVMGFGPSLYKYFSGELFFPPIIHVHATIMIGWVVLYTVQAGIATHGNLNRHRQVG